jgi:hypothetical protein
MTGDGVPKSVRTLQSADIADTVNPDSVYVVSGAPLAVRPPKPIVVLVEVLSGDGDVVEPPHPAPGTAARLKTTPARRRCLTTDLDCRTGRPASSRLLFPPGDSRTASLSILRLSIRLDTTVRSAGAFRVGGVRLERR